MTTAETLIPVDAEGFILATPAVFDALRKAGLLRQVGTMDAAGAAPWPVWGYEEEADESGFALVRCWLVAGEAVQAAAEEDEANTWPADADILAADEAGLLAYEADASSTENPHRNPVLREAWLDGWTRAKRAS